MRDERERGKEKKVVYLYIIVIFCLVTFITIGISITINLLNKVLESTNKIYAISILNCLRANISSSLDYMDEFYYPGISDAESVEDLNKINREDVIACMSSYLKQASSYRVYNMLLANGTPYSIGNMGERVFLFNKEPHEKFKLVNIPYGFYTTTKLYGKGYESTLVTKLMSTTAFSPGTMGMVCDTKIAGDLLSRFEVITYPAFFEILSNDDKPIYYIGKLDTIQKISPQLIDKKNKILEEKIKNSINKKDVNKDTNNTNKDNSQTQSIYNDIIQFDNKYFNFPGIESLTSFMPIVENVYSNFIASLQDGISVATFENKDYEFYVLASNKYIHGIFICLLAGITLLYVIAIYVRGSLKPVISFFTFAFISFIIFDIIQFYIIFNYVEMKNVKAAMTYGVLIDDAISYSNSRLDGMLNYIYRVKKRILDLRNTPKELEATETFDKIVEHAKDGQLGIKDIEVIYPYEGGSEEYKAIFSYDNNELCKTVSSTYKYYDKYIYVRIKAKANFDMIYQICNEKRIDDKAIIIYEGVKYEFSKEKITRTNDIPKLSGKKYVIGNLMAYVNGINNPIKIVSNGKTTNSQFIYTYLPDNYTKSLVYIASIDLMSFVFFSTILLMCYKAIRKKLVIKIEKENDNSIMDDPFLTIEEKIEKLSITNEASILNGKSDMYQSHNDSYNGNDNYIGNSDNQRDENMNTNNPDKEGSRIRDRYHDRFTRRKNTNSTLKKLEDNIKNFGDEDDSKNVFSINDELIQKTSEDNEFIYLDLSSDTITELIDEYKINKVHRKKDDKKKKKNNENNDEIKQSRQEALANKYKKNLHEDEEDEYLTDLNSEIMKQYYDKEDDENV